jgi:2-polyprenyl-3-methyl-5-hydroxy-6-metoxy-1,4-benzoquinol methylase
VTPSLAESNRSARERAHGARLSQGDPDWSWGWSSVAGQERARRRADLLAEGAGLGRGSRVLEIGCGTGIFTARLASSGADVTAVDVSPDLIERARARGLPDVHFVLGDFTTAELGGPFDAVVGSSVLHHLPVADSLLRIHQLLVPGGRLAFAEPNFLNPQIFLERTLRFLPYYSSYTSPDETAFVRWLLARALQRAGFAEVAIVPHDWLHPSTPATLLRSVARAGRVLETLPLVREFAGSLLITAHA